MLGELDEKQSYKTISYCPEVENLDGKQTTQKKQKNKQTNKQTKNPKKPRITLLVRAPLILTQSG